VTVHAGDDAIYTPSRGKPFRVRVERITAKRVAVSFVQSIESGRNGLCAIFHLRHVKRDRLAKVPGGGLLDGCNESP
jgi:hypothetical protein